MLVLKCFCISLFLIIIIDLTNCAMKLKNYLQIKSMKTHYISPNIAKTPSPTKFSSSTAVSESNQSEEAATLPKQRSIDNTPIKKEPFTVVVNSVEKRTICPAKSPKKGKGKNRKSEKISANKKMAQTEVPADKMTELKVSVLKCSL